MICKLQTEDKTSQSAKCHIHLISRKTWIPFTSMFFYTILSPVYHLFLPHDATIFVINPSLMAISPCGGFLKWGYPQNINFHRIVQYKPSHFGVPHGTPLWKPHLFNPLDQRHATWSKPLPCSHCSRCLRPLQWSRHGASCWRPGTCRDRRATAHSLSWFPTSHGGTPKSSSRHGCVVLETMIWGIHFLKPSVFFSKGWQVSNVSMCFNRTCFNPTNLIENMIQKMLNIDFMYEFADV